LRSEGRRNLHYVKAVGCEQAQHEVMPDVRLIPPNAERVMSDVGSVSPVAPDLPQYWPGSAKTSAALSTRLTRSDPTQRDPFTDPVYHSR
jgi:hypothetical protein